MSTLKPATCREHTIDVTWLLKACYAEPCTVSGSQD